MTGHRERARRKLACVLLALGALALPVPAAGSAPASQGKNPVAKIRAIARPDRVEEGSLVTVVVQGRNLRNVGAAAFHLVFDPSFLEPLPEGFTEGPLLRSDGTPTIFMARPAGTGDRIVVGLTRLGGGRGARGEGALCRLTFRALKTGRTTVRFEREQLLTPRSAPKRARFIPARLRVSGGGDRP